MYTNTLATLADCQAVVRRYGLGPSDFATGSVEGFTAYLLCRGMELHDVWNLATRLDAYRAEAAAGLDEAALLEEARGLNELLNDHAQARRDIATHIETLKGDPRGKALWACIAELATSPAPQHDAICARRGTALEEVRMALAWLKQFEWFVFESVYNFNYVPGSDLTLDHLLRKDIELFDQTLIEAAPWSVAQDDTAYELNAVCRLIGMEARAKAA